MSIAELLTVLKNELVQKIVPEVVELLASALQEGTPAHKVEENLWDAHQSHGAKGLEVFGPSGVEYVGQIAKYSQTELVKKLAPYAYERPTFVISETGVTQL
jgi:hypothetical protein